MDEGSEQNEQIISRAHQTADELLLDLQTAQPRPDLMALEATIRNAMDLIALLHNFHDGLLKSGWPCLSSRLHLFAAVRDRSLRVGDGWFASAHEAVSRLCTPWLFAAFGLEEVYRLARRHLPSCLGWGGDEGFNQVGFSILIQRHLARDAGADDLGVRELEGSVASLSSINPSWEVFAHALSDDDQFKATVNQLFQRTAILDRNPFEPPLLSLSDGDRLGAEMRIEYAKVADRSHREPGIVREPVPGPLSERAALIYEMLLRLPPYRGMTSRQILDELADKHVFIDQSSLTTRLIPELKAYGVENRPRIGYFIRQDGRNRR